MLLILTGDIQTGKTRWLEKLVANLSAHDVRVEGVLAPGIWRSIEDAPADAPTSERFEKLGIDNVLLPGGQRIRFALRRDLAETAEEPGRYHQSDRAQLGWAIFDDAIAEVNLHFARLRSVSDTHDEPCLLVVDELGRLELEHSGGLTEAVALLEDGPQYSLHHALIVVRSNLADIAAQRFSDIWGEVRRIAPCDEARELVYSLMGVSE